MLREIKKNSVFQIKQDDFILIDDEYFKIVDYKIANNKGYATLENKEEFIIENPKDYKFGTLTNTKDYIGVDITYNCQLCKNPNVVFETEWQADEHAQRCLFNPNKKSCVLCKHLKIIEYPPYPRFEKEYQSMETYHAFGAYKQPYCMKKDKNIDEYELFDNHDDCFVYSEEPAVTETTDEFETYLELINKDMNEELKKELEEVYDKE